MTLVDVTGSQAVSRELKRTVDKSMSIIMISVLYPVLAKKKRELRFGSVQIIQLGNKLGGP